MQTPSFTISTVTNSALPRATIKMSAVLVISLRFWVLLCVRVTVQFPGLLLRAIKILIGEPTI